MVEILQDFKPFFGIKQMGIPDVGALHYLQKLGVIDIGSNSDAWSYLMAPLDRHHISIMKKFYVDWVWACLVLENSMKKVR